MSTDRCCSRSVLYNIRRYDPVGRTLWVRDYFAGYTGQLAGDWPASCRVIVDGDRIFVTGPMVWADHERPSTWWNAACYTIDGGLLWRAKVGATAANVLDCAMVNGTYYALLDYPEYRKTTIASFDRNGVTLETWPCSVIYGRGVRFVVGNPAVTYAAADPLPAGLLTLGLSESVQAIHAVYDPADDNFVIVPTPLFNPPPPFPALLRTPEMGNAVIGNSWAEANLLADWIVFNWLHDVFGDVDRKFVGTHEVGLAPGKHVICAADFGPYTLFDGESDSILGSGSLVRLDDAGSPVWFRGLASMGCLATDESRIFSATRVASNQHPTVMRWTQDGDFVWGHFHNAVGQIRIVDDRGIVTIGNRQEFGRDEINWVREGSA